MKKIVFIIALAVCFVPSVLFGMKSEKGKEKERDRSESVVVDVGDELEGLSLGAQATKGDELGLMKDLLPLPEGMTHDVFKMLITSLEKNNPQLVTDMRSLIYQPVSKRGRGDTSKSQMTKDEFMKALVGQLSKANELMKLKMAGDDKELQLAKQTSRLRYLVSLGLSVVFSLAGTATGIAGLVMAAKAPDTTFAECVKTCLVDAAALVDPCVRSCVA